MFKSKINETDFKKIIATPTVSLEQDEKRDQFIAKLCGKTIS